MSGDFQRIAYFKTAAETGNLSRAAKILNITQPALSKSIAQLEREVGTDLFDRTGRSLELNEAGAIFLSHANRALAQMDAARQQLDELKGIRERTVGFLPLAPTGKPGYSAYLFHKEHPDIILEYHYQNEGDADSSADVSLFASVDPVLDSHTKLLAEEEFVAVLPNEHPLATRSSLRVAELAGEPFVFSSTPTMNRLQTDLCRSAGFEPTIAAKLQLYNDVLGMVHYGLGVTVAPRLSWMMGFEEDFALIPLTDVHVTRRLYLRYPEDAHPSYATQKFSAFLEEYFTQNPRLHGQ
ncbi:MAG: LysR family transcriptional regulator [Eggerthellaceae bacterium]|jgi:LysR family transcriptional activator of glutamate synthase operon